MARANSQFKVFRINNPMLLLVLLPLVLVALAFFVVIMLGNALLSPFRPRLGSARARREAEPLAAQSRPATKSPVIEAEFHHVN